MDDSSGTGAPPAAERDPRASTENGPIPPSVTLRDGNAAPLAGFPERFLAKFSDYAITAAFLVAAVPAGRAKGSGAAGGGRIAERHAGLLRPGVGLLRSAPTWPALNCSHPAEWWHAEPERI